MFELTNHSLTFRGAGQKKKKKNSKNVSVSQSPAASASVAAAARERKREREREMAEDDSNVKWDFTLMMRTNVFDLVSAISRLCVCECGRFCRGHFPALWSDEIKARL